MKTHQLTRNKIQEEQPLPVTFRPPEDVSDLVYDRFYALAHKQKIEPETRAEDFVPVPRVSTLAFRLIRREALTAAKLRELKALILAAQKGEEVNPVVFEILGGDATLAWIDSCLPE